MAGPWRVRFIHHDDPTWQRLIDAGIIPSDGGPYDLFQAAKASPTRVMEAAGGFMPWPFFSAHGDAPDAPPLGAFVICPQCGQEGSVHVRRDPRFSGAVWDWNGSADAPTVKPSILSTPPTGCGGHYFLTNGVLTDCGGHRPL